MTGQSDDDGNFQSDLRRLLGRRAALGLLAAGGAGALWLGLRGRAQAQVVSGIGADGAVCIVPAAETAGPFPGDGTNVRAGQTVNVLTEAGVLRSDLTESFGGYAGTAEGVPLTLTIRLVDVNAVCAGVGGLALYLWHCDATGRYSLYTMPEANWLRGLQISGPDGTLTFQTIVPGCYPGRWPHVHFEVFRDAGAAVSGDKALLTAQFALTDADCRTVYATDSRYGDSLRHLDGTSLGSDMVFADNAPEQLAAQTIVLTGDASSGYRGSVTVGLIL